MKSRGVDFAEVKRICQDCTLAGLRAVYEAGPSRPFRFLYLSAEGTSRDLTRKPLFMGEYQLMRVSALSSLIGTSTSANEELSRSTGRNGEYGGRVWCGARGSRGLCCSPRDDYVFGDVSAGGAVPFV